jgi:hypothetical protein
MLLQVADIVAKQRRIERQDKPTVDGVSFEHSAAGAVRGMRRAAGSSFQQAADGGSKRRH